MRAAIAAQRGVKCISVVRAEYPIQKIKTRGGEIEVVKQTNCMLAAMTLYTYKVNLILLGLMTCICAQMHIYCIATLCSRLDPRIYVSLEPQKFDLKNSDEPQPRRR